MNLLAFGWQWAGLQDYATNPAASAHPYLYIHHGNLGLYFSYVLAQLGIVSIEAQNAVSWVASLVGLMLAYLFVKETTKRRLPALLVLTFLALDFRYIDDWALNVHRAFTYMSVFGTALPFQRMLNDKITPGRFTAFGVASALLLGADYIFFFFMFLLLSLMAALTNWRRLLPNIAILAATFGALFALRQVQVFLGAGWNVWSHDFLYQILNRLHLERLFPGDWQQVTSDFYETNHILNPGFAPAVSWSERISAFASDTGGVFLTHVLNIGHHSTAALMCGIVLVGGVFVVAFRRDELSRLALALLLACLAMYALFPRYFLQWYPEFLLGVICVSVWLASLLEVLPTAAVAAAVALKVIVVAYGTASAQTDVNTQADILRRMAGQPIASNWTPSSVSSYTDAFAGWLKADAVDKLITTGRVEPSDYFMLFEADRDSNPLYKSPRYFVFFKAYGTEAQLAAIRAKSQPSHETAVLAVFDVLPR
jgi:hypothetical protein